MTLTRRDFLRTSAIGLCGLAVFPGCTSSRKKEDDIIRMGVIGMGRQAQYLIDGFLHIPGVKLVAGCDVYEVKRNRFKQVADGFYQAAGQESNVDLYESYNDLLGRKDIDAVVIATPDHWHAAIAVAACKAGKDVYLEKPVTFTIAEGKALVKAVRDNNRILQVGSQQRSDKAFQHAVKMVQSGKLGNITKVTACVGAPPTPYNLPEEPVPGGLNWSMWLGPIDQPIHYNHELNPPISLDPKQDEQLWGAWRWYKETGGGYTTDWGAHMFDIAQWALGKQYSGPVEVIPAGYGNTKALTFKYDNGVILTEEPFDEAQTKGIKFEGDKGWIEMSREHYACSSPELELPAEDKKDGAYETSPVHLTNFIDAVRSRQEPCTPIEIGHRSCTVCSLGNMATDLQRPVKWNPDTESFVDDPEAEAHRLYSYEYRNGISL